LEPPALPKPRRGTLQALSPAVAPRALWVAAHHAALPRRLPGAWANVLDWIDALLQRGLTDESSKVWRAM
jgi:hypothetical protein